MGRFFSYARRMATYEITQRLMSLATYYDVCESGSDDVIMHVKGEFMAPTPTLKLFDDKTEKQLASVHGNFNKTHFTVRDASDKTLAEIDFPWVAIKKKMRLKIGDKTYEADAGILSSLYDFACEDADGKAVLHVKKPEGLTKVRDRFIVEPTDVVAKEIALLTAVAIHSRYFEMI